MAKWVVNLSGYEIGYEPRTAIKSQALADFVADFSPTLEQEAAKETANLANDDPIGTWTLHTDGASNIRGTGLGVVLKSPQGDNIAQAVRCEWDATNNEAEYEAMIFGLHLAIDVGIKDISVTCDSLLIVNHVQFA